jgi:hypothetical protein
MNIIRLLDEMCLGRHESAGFSVTYHIAHSVEDAGSGSGTAYLVSDREGNLSLQEAPPDPYQRGSVQVRNREGEVVMSAFITEDIEYTMLVLVGRLQKRGGIDVRTLEWTLDHSARRRRGREGRSAKAASPQL